MKTKLSFVGFAAVLFLSGCDYDAPLTATATHPIDARLVGDWIPAGKEEEKDSPMHVRRWDDNTYAIAIENDIYRTWHSDCAGLALVSAQDLNSDERKFCLYTWALSPDGAQLTLRRVRTEVVPDAAKTTAALQAAVKANAANPKLLDEPLVFQRQLKK
ncbi:MAG TPA: hypothetical protein VG734_10165 [Lacunisphaera sp.]|nr:hypothetical protein [Lacunisphaera sp.]